jgi:hypothetical protein
MPMQIILFLLIIHVKLVLWGYSLILYQEIAKVAILQIAYSVQVLALVRLAIQRTLTILTQILLFANIAMRVTINSSIT